jgi:RNA polymerase sigma-70 factor, ECF subfamily
MARPAIRPGAPHRAATGAAYTARAMPYDADPAGSGRPGPGQPAASPAASDPDDGSRAAAGLDGADPAGPGLDRSDPDGDSADSADGADFAVGPEDPEPADAGLDAALTQAQRGDADAFRALYRDTQPRLLRYLRALVSDDAEDLASETWLHITRDLHTFTGTYDNFRGWAATIARHRALDHLRRHARRPPPILVPAEDLASLAATDDTATTAIDAVATDTAIALIATLPPDQAEAVLLRAVLGLDATRAAAVLGKRPGAVRTAAYRGLRTLAHRLEKEGTA